MKSLKQKEKELQKLEEQRQIIKSCYQETLKKYENKNSEEIKTKICELALEKEKIETKINDLDYSIKIITELTSIRNKISGFCYLALTEHESEKAAKIINEAIERWLSK